MVRPFSLEICCRSSIGYWLFTSTRKMKVDLLKMMAGQIEFVMVLEPENNTDWQMIGLLGL